MCTFAQKPKAIQQTHSATSTKPVRALSGQSREVSSILHLQRTIGNQAVQRLLKASVKELEAGSVSAETTRFAYDFSQMPLYPKAKAHTELQQELTVGTPGDIYEQEADRIANQVLQMPETEVQRVGSCGGGCQKCGTTQASRRIRELEIERIRTTDTNENAISPIVQEVLSSPGQPLAPTIRDFFEPRFGHDFSQVRVHTGSTADESAKSVQAKAFTVGNNIVFGQGHYVPGTSKGKMVLAHELTHVLQQRQQPLGGALLQRLGTCYGNMPPQPGIDPEDPFDCERLLRIEGVTSCTSECYFYNDDVQPCIDGICPGHPDYDPTRHPNYRPQAGEAEAEYFFKHPCFAGRNCTGRRYAKKRTHCHQCRRDGGRSLLKPTGCENC